ncbi:MAG: chromate transporter [Clostridia bacterium]|nr:chromate transporter [Clostridia bacterium]
MIYLNLFWTFFKIGLFTFGGGQAMIPMIMREVTARGWISETDLIDFIAISESTPGTFAVNISTYTGVQTAGVLGALCSTIGVVLPSIIIITLIALLFASLMKKQAVGEVFGYIRSSVTGLLTAVLISLFMLVLFGISSVYDTSKASADYIGLGLFAILFGLSFIKIKGRKISPIILILISAVLGLLCYGFIPV